MIVRNVIAFSVFRGIQIVGFPLAVVAYVLFVVRLIGYSRRSGASATVLASFYPRWMQHQLGTRRDEPCARLMVVLPNVSPLGLRLLTGPTLLAHRLTGYVPKIYRYPYQGVPPMKDQPAARTTFFDVALEWHLAGIDQLVILGAGLDTRSYRLPAGTRIRCFEVDTPRTQSFKRAMLKKAGVDTTRVTYVPADFEHEDWFEKLVDAGFEPDKPSFFLWESVTMYLDRDAVESTLRKIAGTAPGSVVAFDYFSTELLKDRSLMWRYAGAVLNAVGEPFGTFGLDTTPPVRKQVAAFLESCGLCWRSNATSGRRRTGSTLRQASPPQSCSPQPLQLQELRRHARTHRNARAKHTFIKPHCPWQNGKVERYNQTLQIEWAYRQVFYSTTNAAGPLLPGWSSTTLNAATPHSMVSHQSADCHQLDGRRHLAADLAGLAAEG